VRGCNGCCSVVRLVPSCSSSSLMLVYFLAFVLPLLLLGRFNHEPSALVVVKFGPVCKGNECGIVKYPRSPGYQPRRK